MICVNVFFVFSLPLCLAFRCVQILAAEHRYKLLIAEKKKRKTPEQEGEEEKNADTEKPKKTPKAKAKASTTKKKDE